MQTSKDGSRRIWASCHPRGHGAIGILDRTATLLGARREKPEGLARCARAIAHRDRDPRCRPALLETEIACVIWTASDGGRCPPCDFMRSNALDEWSSWRSTPPVRTRKLRGQPCDRALQRLPSSLVRDGDAETGPCRISREGSWRAMTIRTAWQSDRGAGRIDARVVANRTLWCWAREVVRRQITFRHWEVIIVRRCCSGTHAVGRICGRWWNLTCRLAFYRFERVGDFPMSLTLKIVDCLAWLLGALCWA